MKPWIMSLSQGDRVWWDDPDDGLCSREYKIQSVVVSGEEVRIMDADGSTLVCPPWEIRRNTDD